MVAVVTGGWTAPPQLLIAALALLILMREFTRNTEAAVVHVGN